MRPYIASFEVGFFYRLVKENFVEMQDKEKFSPEEENHIEKRLVKVKKRINRTSFNSQSEINVLEKKLHQLNKYIWLHSIKLGN